MCWFQSTANILVRTGLQIFFFKIGGPNCPIEQEMVGHFLK